MKFYTKETEDQYIRFLLRFRPKQHQQYIETKKKRPPDFEDGDLDKTDDATTTTTSLPTEEQPSTKSTTKLDSYDSYDSSLGGSNCQFDSEKMMLIDMKTNLEATKKTMAALWAAQDAQIEQLQRRWQSKNTPAKGRPRKYKDCNCRWRSLQRPVITDLIMIMI